MGIFRVFCHIGYFVLTPIVSYLISDNKTWPWPVLTHSAISQSVIDLNDRLNVIKHACNTNCLFVRGLLKGMTKRNYLGIMALCRLLAHWVFSNCHVTQFWQRTQNLPSVSSYSPILIPSFNVKTTRVII